MAAAGAPGLPTGRADVGRGDGEYSPGKRTPDLIIWAFGRKYLDVAGPTLGTSHPERSTRRLWWAVGATHRMRGMERARTLRQAGAISRRYPTEADRFKPPGRGSVRTGDYRAGRRASSKRRPARRCRLSPARSQRMASRLDSRKRRYMRGRPTPRRRSRPPSGSISPGALGMWAVIARLGRCACGRPTARHQAPARFRAQNFALTLGHFRIADILRSARPGGWAEGHVAFPLHARRTSHEHAGVTSHRTFGWRLRSLPGSERRPSFAMRPLQDSWKSKLTAARVLGRLVSRRCADFVFRNREWGISFSPD